MSYRLHSLSLRRGCPCGTSRCPHPLTVPPAARTCARPGRLPCAYGWERSMAMEQNTAGPAPLPARTLPLAAAPRCRPLTRAAIGLRRRRPGPQGARRGRTAGRAPRRRRRQGRGGGAGLQPPAGLAAAPCAHWLGAARGRVEARSWRGEAMTSSLPRMEPQEGRGRARGAAPAAPFTPLRMRTAPRPGHARWGQGSGGAWAGRTFGSHGSVQPFSGCAAAGAEPCSSALRLRVFALPEVGMPSHPWAACSRLCSHVSQ